MSEATRLGLTWENLELPKQDYDEGQSGAYTRFPCSCGEIQCITAAWNKQEGLKQAREPYRSRMALASYRYGAGLGSVRSRKVTNECFTARRALWMPAASGRTNCSNAAPAVQGVPPLTACLPTGGFVLLSGVLCTG
ncbi:hypothetical protein TRVL_04474 [Trypanosoma vivax]|nr:hypothetical protein TRVL_04474 [Trypanosoma vivax]